MPRKQRFKPSRKPKPVEPTTPATQAQMPEDPQSRPGAHAMEHARPPTHDAPSES